MSERIAGPDFDEYLASREFLADPYPTLRRLREHDPVHWSDSLGGWVVTRYDDVLQTYLDVDHYSNEGRISKAIDDLPPNSRQALSVFAAFYGAKGLVHADPPDHTRLRRLILKWGFTPGQIEALRPRIQEIVDALIDQVIPNGNMDVIEDLAFALPVTVLCELMGVPPSDREKFRHLADRLLGFQGRRHPTMGTLLRAQEAIVELRAYVAMHAERIRGGDAPGDGLLARLLVAQAEEEALTDDEMVNTVGTLLIAGHETTTSLVGNGLLTILGNADQWQLLRDCPSLLPRAIEEMLRYESPLARQPRLVRQDTELQGRPIRKGEAVLQMINGANRDPAYFPDPEEFNIERPIKQHLAFGHGIHFCLGAPLARLEAHVVFRTILERIPGIRLMSDGPDWDLSKPTVRILRTLPVAF